MTDSERIEQLEKQVLALSATIERFVGGLTILISGGACANTLQDVKTEDYLLPELDGVGL